MNRGRRRRSMQCAGTGQLSGGAVGDPDPALGHLAGVWSSGLGTAGGGADRDGHAFGTGAAEAAVAGGGRRAVFHAGSCGVERCGLVGGILFVWLAGLELDLGAVWAHRRETGVVAGLALVMPLAFGTAAAALLLLTPGWIGPKTQVWQAALGIGMACAVTALPILVLVLEELGLLGQPLGQRVLRYASLDDVAIWAVLAAILLDLERLGRQLGFLLVFALAGWSRRTACSWLWSGWSHPRLLPTGRAALGWHSFVRPC